MVFSNFKNLTVSRKDYNDCMHNAESDGSK